MTLPDTAIILAAGRGSRLGNLSDEVPKCLVRLDGVPLLEWQMSALKRAGVTRVVVVCGYRCESIAALGVETIVNPHWASTNMVASLLCARHLISQPVIVSYSDIVYDADVARRVREAPGDLAISYDVDWLDLWTRRFDDPLSDAESFRLDSHGRVAEIGSRVSSLGVIQGQYMGLLKLNGTALKWIEEYIAAQPDPDFRSKVDMTGLLSGLLKHGYPVDAVPVRGGWCEIDSPRDLAVAHEWLVSGRLGPLQGGA